MDINNLKCFICHQEEVNLQKNDVLCIQCNIVIHSNCYEKTRENRGYTKCPNCRRIGCMGISDPTTHE